MELAVQDWLGRHECVISDAVTKYDMILGRDWLKANKVRINHDSDSIEIRGTTQSFTVESRPSEANFEDYVKNLTEFEEDDYDSLDKQLSEIHSEI